MMQDWRDRRLVAAVSGGDGRALSELYRRHARLLAVRLSGRGLPAPDVEDVLQETFSIVWSKAHTYRGEGAVAAWLWGIARNQGATALRRRKPVEPLEAEPIVPDGADGWLERVEAERLLDQLDPDLRSTVSAIAVAGMSVAEAAEHLGIPEGTVKSRMHRFRSLVNEESP